MAKEVLRMNDLAGKTESAADRAHRGIRAAIASGEFEAGAMLSESELATRLAMSRTPIRTALSRLQDEGWITVYPKRGALVREIGAREAQELADARHALEALGARRAVDLRRLADSLEPVLADQREAALVGDVATFVESDIAFHRGFVDAAGNPLLTGFYDRLRDRQALLITRGVVAVAERLDEILKEHDGLLALLRDEDADSFDTALRAHLQRTTEAMTS
ncbi:GntR family transcriptional regulator [Curtobacterium sp. MCBA15_001]|uniref:GntR family transcriptional regulator n=1 Tax=Curtobacterium sp. MCBA15_001 TaxID=1898731 RepID=UPI0009F2E9BB|nr:GntR family transcriptional regulator [Curtobacterium sp. MCBA15_001]